MGDLPAQSYKFIFSHPNLCTSNAHSTEIGFRTAKRLVSSDRLTGTIVHPCEALRSPRAD